jgi:hypothetical protein
MFQLNFPRSIKKVSGAIIKGDRSCENTEPQIFLYSLLGGHLTTSRNCSGGPRSNKLLGSTYMFRYPIDVLCNLMYIPEINPRDTQGVPETFQPTQRPAFVP